MDEARQPAATFTVVGLLIWKSVLLTTHQPVKVAEASNGQTNPIHPPFALHIVVTVPGWIAASYPATSRASNIRAFLAKGQKR